MLSVGHRRRSLLCRGEADIDSVRRRMEEVGILLLRLSFPLLAVAAGVGVEWILVLRVDPGGAFGAAGDGGGGGAVLPLASRAGCCARSVVASICPAAWRGAAARGAGWRACQCGCCSWWLLRRRFSAAAGPRLVIVPAAVAWRERRLRFAIISPGSSSSSSVLVPVPATSLWGFFCSRWRLVGGDGFIFVEFGTPDFSHLRRRVLRCRRRVCEFLHRSFSGLFGYSFVCRCLSRVEPQRYCDVPVAYGFIR